jgi:hypothetical protein
MYSGGMPLLYLIGAVYCTISYWADKVCMLRGARQPPTYNEDLVKQAVNWIFLAGFVHVAITSWMYGFQDIFPSYYSQLLGLFESILSITESEYDEIMADWSRNYKHLKYPRFGDYIRARMLDMSRYGCVFISITLLVFGLYFIFYGLIWKGFVRHLDCSQEAVRKLVDYMHAKLEGPAAHTPHEDVDIDVALDKQGKDTLLSYKMEANPKYKTAYDALKFCETNDMPEGAEGADGTVQGAKRQTTTSSFGLQMQMPAVV